MNIKVIQKHVEIGVATNVGKPIAILEKTKNTYIIIGIENPPPPVNKRRE